MKSKLLIFYIFSILSFSINAQFSKTCTKPKIEDFDLNSISKCATGKKKKRTKGNKSTKASNRKASNHIIRKRVKKSSGSSSDLKKAYQNEKIKDLGIKEVLFTVVDTAPLFSNKCNSSSDKKRCFNIQVKKHFNKNFFPERASDNGINGKVFIQFTIDVNGRVKNLIVRAPKHANRLEQEVKRVVSKLPTFQPATHNGMPVNVKYSLPISFSAD